MTYYVDAFMIGKNPSPVGGGFTVVNEHNELVKRHTMDAPGITNNHLELLAVAYGAFIAEKGDTIITDSQTAYYWSKSGEPKPRPDLRKIAQAARQWIRKKSLNVEWKKRDVNLAGIYNEHHKH